MLFIVVLQVNLKQAGPVACESRARAGAPFSANLLVPLRVSDRNPEKVARVSHPTSPARYAGATFPVFSVIYYSRFTIYDYQPMTNEEIARRFNRMASLMEIRGEDTFRIRSYRMAAEAIERWPRHMKEIAKKEGAAGLQEIPGVGKATAGKILELIDRGSFDAWDKLTAETPETVLDLLDLPGVGPKTAATFHQKFKVSSLEDLRKFVAGGGLETVDGIGPKTEARIKSR